MQEARELANDPCTDYSAAPLEVHLDSLLLISVPVIYDVGIVQDDIFVSLCRTGLHVYG